MKNDNAGKLFGVMAAICWLIVAVIFMSASPTAHADDVYWPLPAPACFEAQQDCSMRGIASRVESYLARYASSAETYIFPVEVVSEDNCWVDSYWFTTEVVKIKKGHIKFKNRTLVHEARRPHLGDCS